MKYVSYVRGKSCLDFDVDTKSDENIVKKQLECAHNYADAHGFLIEKDYIDADEESVAFDELLQNGMNRMFECIVVPSIYRVSKTIWRAKEVLFQKFYYAGIHFIVIEDEFDSQGKSPKEVEKYFDNKYHEFKSLLLTARNNEYYKNVTKVQHEEKVDKRHVSKHAYSMIFYELYDQETKAHFNLRNLNGTPAFVLVGKGFHYYANEKDRIAIHVAEASSLKALLEERKLAERISDRLAKGEGKEILREKLEKIGNDLQFHFFMIVSGEKKLEETEDFFLKSTDYADKLEKAFTVNNPWIRNMLSLDVNPDTVLTRKLVKQYIDKIWVTNFTTFKIESRWEQWKRLLPEEWMV